MVFWTATADLDAGIMRSPGLACNAIEQHIVVLGGFCRHQEMDQAEFTRRVERVRFRLSIMGQPWSLGARISSFQLAMPRALGKQAVERMHRVASRTCNSDFTRIGAANSCARSRPPARAVTAKPARAHLRTQCAALDSVDHHFISASFGMGNDQTYATDVGRHRKDQPTRAAWAHSPDPSQSRLSNPAATG